MKTRKPVTRRQFMTASAAAGCLTLAPFNSWGAPTPATRPPNKTSLDEVMKEMEARGRQFLSVPRKDGEFLQLLVKLARARNVLEIGTSQGYGALWIALGLEETNGRLTTIEIRPDRVAMARQNLTRAGLVHRITFKQGDAHQLLRDLDGPFDFVFLDADKEGQLDYFNQLFPKKLPPGGLLVAHNAIRAAAGMQDYLDMVRNHAEFDSSIVSATMDDGFALSYRKRK